MTVSEKLQKELFALRDEKYRDFQAKLIPTLDKSTVIGVRTPVLRKFSKQYNKSPDKDEFMRTLPHKYYDENNLHGFLIEQIKDYDECIIALDLFLPYIDNWATCDLISPKIFKKNTDRLFEKIKIWIKSDKVYTIRFAIEMLMTFFLDERFTIEAHELVSAVKSDEYYVNMMIAWYFATALAKQYQDTLPYIENHRLDPWTNNKAIQKSVESYRITDEQKVYLKTLKIK